MGFDLWASLAPQLESHVDTDIISRAFADDRARETCSERFRHSLTETVEHLQVLSTLMLQRKQTFAAATGA